MGYDSNKSRGMRKKANTDDAMPRMRCLLENSGRTGNALSRQYMRLIPCAVQTEPVYIPELFYDYSDSQIPVFDYWS